MKSATASTLLAGACVAIAVIAFALVLDASYPGYPHPDSFRQAGEALYGGFTDWHSPFVSLLWALLLKLKMDPTVFIVFNNLLIWGGTLGFALAMKRRFGLSAMLLLAVPLLPGTVNFLGNPHVDALLVAWLIAGICAAYFSRQDQFSDRARLRLQMLASLCFAAAFLTRLNAIFALIPLLLYANTRPGLRRNLVTCMVFIVAMPLLYKLQNTLIGAKATSPSDSIKVYNLLALSHFDRRNVLPGNWTERQSKAIVHACYSPIQWDTAWDGGQCQFIYDELNSQRIWGSWKLTEAWLDQILRHPGQYFNILSATFKQSMYEPNSRSMLFRIPNPWHWEVKNDPPRATTKIAQDYVRSSINDHLSRPWLFALLSATSLLLLFRSRAVATEEGRLALALLASGMVYLLTYFFFNVSAEYRYFYWVGFASYFGFLITILSSISGADNRAETRTEQTVRHAALALGALGATLVVFPFRLPMDSRIFTINPLDARPVVMVGIRNIATPRWIAEPFQGKVEPVAWSRDQLGQSVNQARAPLVATLETLREDIEIVLATGPEMGQANIETQGFQSVIDTQSAQGGTTSIVIPPLAPTDTGQWQTTRLNLAAAILCFIAILVLMLKLSLPAKRSGMASPVSEAH